MKTTTLFFLGLFVSGICFADSRPNIIWIEADDLMPRFMNKLGEGFGLTPNLDRLATMGVHFPTAVCQGPMCGPSRNGLLANLYSHNLGLYKNKQMRNMPKGTWTFPRVLNEAGYQTAYIGKSHMRPPAEDPTASKDEALKFYGFDYVQCTGERFMLYKYLREGKSIADNPFIKHLKKRGKYRQFVNDRGHVKPSSMEEDIDYLDGFTAQVAVNWMTKERDTDRPFFMWFNFCLPHDPYNAPQRYWDMVSHITIPPPKTDSFAHKLPQGLIKNPPLKGNEAAKHRLGEAANVAFMDAQIGRLIDALKTSGQIDNTVIIFFSDHSIFLGNHGVKFKGNLFEECLNTSMIVCYPKRFPQAQDQINPHPMEVMDLVPTTFELAGVKDPNEVAKNGLSIVPLLEGKETNGRKFGFSEIEGAQSATDARYRYITCEGIDILYDHKTDPWEMDNVAPQYPEITARMKKAVADWMHHTGPVYPPNTF